MSGTNKIIPVILCGGAGTRLWPISHNEFPKQFHNLIGQNSLLHQTLERAVECTDINPSDIITVTSQDFAEETLEQINNFDPKASRHLISEPCARNTAAAIANAVLYAQKHFSDNALLWIMPSDHYIQDTQKLKHLINTALSNTNNKYIITLGISPDRPETGYGYIKAGDKITDSENIYAVNKFIEKPDYDTALKFLNDGSYSWNSGMFIATVNTLVHNFEKLSPNLIQTLQKDITLETYTRLPTISFDKAIMEKTDKAVVIKYNMGWSDVGSWESLWRLIASLENKNRKYPVTTQSWGSFKTLLENKDYTIQEMTVKSAQRLNLQPNEQQSKFWTIVKGKAKATINGETKALGLKDNIFIPIKTEHSLENSGSEDLIIIEARQS